MNQRPPVSPILRSQLWIAADRNESARIDADDVVALLGVVEDGEAISEALDRAGIDAGNRAQGTAHRLHTLPERVDVVISDRARSISNEALIRDSLKANVAESMILRSGPRGAAWVSVKAEAQTARRELAEAKEELALAISQRDLALTSAETRLETIGDLRQEIHRLKEAAQVLAQARDHMVESDAGTESVGFAAVDAAVSKVEDPTKPPRCTHDLSGYERCLLPAGHAGEHDYDLPF